MTRLVLFELFVTNLLLFEHQHTQKLLISWQFSGPYGVTKYGSGWRKDVVNQRLEFGTEPLSAFRHLPPNSARFSYATEGALFISEQLSTDAVSALRKV